MTPARLKGTLLRLNIFRRFQLYLGLAKSLISFDKESVGSNIPAPVSPRHTRRKRRKGEIRRIESKHMKRRKIAERGTETTDEMEEEAKKGDNLRHIQMGLRAIWQY